LSQREFQGTLRSKRKVEQIESFFMEQGSTGLDGLTWEVPKNNR
jgi:hypothetical protein